MKCHSENKNLLKFLFSSFCFLMLNLLFGLLPPSGLLFGLLLTVFDLTVSYFVVRY